MEQRGFAEAFLPAGFGRNARLERIAALIDWRPIEALVRQVRPGTTGRAPYRALAMVRALLLQQWYGLSDPGLEEALADRVSFRRFCGLALDEATPDETTLCRFRLALVEAGLGEALFAEVTRQLDAAGFLIKTGTLIDASLVEAAARRQPPQGHAEPFASQPRRQLDAGGQRLAALFRLQDACRYRPGIGPGTQPLPDRGKDL